MTRKPSLLFVAACLAAMPLVAQTQTPAATSTAPVAGQEKGNAEHRSPARNDTLAPGVAATEANERERANRNRTPSTMTSAAQQTTTTTTTTTRRSTRARGNTRTRVHNDATRLAALLHDAQNRSNVSADVWRTIGNEANALANRLYGYTSGNSTARGAARNLRTHVREFRRAALAGNADDARRHASEALPFALRLADWGS